MDFLEKLLGVPLPYPEKYAQLSCRIPDAGAMEYSLLSLSLTHSPGSLENIYTLYFYITEEIHYVTY